MPRSSSRNTASRQWDILKNLPTKAPGITISELFEKISADNQITRRTLERDIIELSIFFCIHSSETRPNRWYLVPTENTDKISGISISDALTLRLVEDSVRPLLPKAILKGLESRFEQARRRLDNLSTSSQPSERWIKKVASVPTDLPLKPPEINETIIDELQDALLNEHQIQCFYHAASGKKSRLCLNPLALIQRGQITYLLAIVESFSDPRLFALHRFLEAKKLKTPRNAPEDFCLNRYIDQGAMQFGELSGNKIKLHAWVCKELARQLKETPLGEDMQLIIDDNTDGFLLTSTQADSWQLRWWLLMQSGRLIVHEPLHLRDEIISKLSSALEMYKK